jgi:hypothetical protein
VQAYNVSSSAVWKIELKYTRILQFTQQASDAARYTICRFRLSPIGPYSGPRRVMHVAALSYARCTQLEKNWTSVLECSTGTVRYIAFVCRETIPFGYREPPNSTESHALGRFMFVHDLLLWRFGLMANGFDDGD